MSKMSPSSTFANRNLTPTHHRSPPPPSPAATEPRPSWTCLTSLQTHPRPKPPPSQPHQPNPPPPATPSAYPECRLASLTLLFNPTPSSHHSRSVQHDHQILEWSRRVREIMGWSGGQGGRGCHQRRWCCGGGNVGALVAGGCGEFFFV
ncbi:hypothetical protein Acr_11g0002590 [Actinidia rufa]|uniref:Uncharacterized protein n=1 Tax=Actinidia rufa TaxID=165716 RepID=A0A7J0FBH0_9ERIC|nr:hypothetical protein Acr_11g0002590 [Actinidia rufa]